MGSICSKIRDDYDDYVKFCKMVNETPVDDRGEKSFYDHQRELCDKHGYVGINEIYKSKQNE